FRVIPIDSIKSDNIDLNPLIVEGISKLNLEACINGVDFYPKIVTKDDTFILDRKHTEAFENFLNIIEVNERKVSIIKQRSIIDSNKKKVTIYATPVTGEFCSSNLSVTGVADTGYNVQLYIPISRVEFIEDYWSPENERQFSDIDLFNSRLPYNFQFN
ncbi:MAG: hypothetical protein HUJ25_00180, partial [Crocinitomicaceae bacterium]|nr:hypothetical protein [Crocinitomicaceae bacterium]